MPRVASPALGLVRWGWGVSLVSLLEMVVADLRRYRSHVSAVVRRDRSRRRSAHWRRAHVAAHSKPGAVGPARAVHYAGSCGFDCHGADMRDAAVYRTAFWRVTLYACAKLRIVRVWRHEFDIHNSQHMRAISEGLRPRSAEVKGRFTRRQQQRHTSSEIGSLDLPHTQCRNLLRS